MPVRALLRLVQPKPAPKYRIPAGVRAYAVGDIHGRLDLLDRLLDDIAADDAGRPAAATQLVFLGDLIDRGPDWPEWWSACSRSAKARRRCAS